MYNKTTMDARYILGDVSIPPLTEFYEQVVRTVFCWYDNHTNFDAWLVWRDYWGLVNELEQDEELMAKLGFKPEDVPYCLDEYCQAYLDARIDATTDARGLPARQIIEQVAAVLEALQAEDVFEALVGLVQACTLAHVNGFMLADYYSGNKTNIYYLVNHISQEGLAAVFPDYDAFVANYQPCDTTFLNMF